MKKERKRERVRETERIRIQTFALRFVPLTHKNKVELELVEASMLDRAEQGLRWWWWGRAIPMQNWTELSVAQGSEQTITHNTTLDYTRQHYTSSASNCSALNLLIGVLHAHSLSLCLSLSLSLSHALTTLVVIVVPALYGNLCQKSSDFFERGHFIQNLASRLIQKELNGFKNLNLSRAFHTTHLLDFSNIIEPLVWKNL